MGEEVHYWFGRALDLPAARRREFLEEECADTAIRAEVVSLLEFDVTRSETGREMHTVGRVVQSAVGTLLGPGGDLPPASRVGHFEVGRLLGSGGMGSVYEGERVDGEVRQRVAIKFATLSPLMDGEARADGRRRFLRERQMLASLGHPYIAGLIDAGATEDGTPYAVIEKVDGIPIDRYCDTGGLNPAERIRLALKLCEAVQFAHSKLIVHSDIKPANVLVTPDGIPKLIDFGIGSELGEERGGPSSMRAFTPGYASPEQRLGMAATVATDVYGIGAVLSRLLSGRGALPSDLANIWNKALHEVPECRYGSVAELRDDLNRYLARRPVRATPDSTVYRVRRFLDRHWAPAVAAASLALALTTATAVAVRQKNHATQHASETRRLAARLLFEVHDEIDGLVGGTKAREKLGAIAAQYLESIEQGSARDPETLWELVNAYSRLAQSRAGAASSIGDTTSGTQLALKTLELGAALEASAAEQKRLDGLFGVYEKLVLIFGEAGLPDRQRETVERLLRLAPKLAPIREAQAWKEQSRYLEKNGGAAESIAAGERAAAILRTLDGQAAAAQLISTLVGLGRSRALAGELRAAEADLNEAIRLAERDSLSDPHRAKSVRQLYWGHLVLGDVLASGMALNLGRTAEGLAHYEKARQIAEGLMQADPANEAARLDLARALTRAGLTLVAAEPARALELFERTNRLRLKTSADCILSLDCRVAYRTGSAEALVRLGSLDRAAAHIAESRLLQVGGTMNENALLRAEAIVAFAAGQPARAIEATRKELALLSSKPAGSLPECFYTEEARERLRSYGGGINGPAPAACSGSPRSASLLASARR